MSPFRFLLVSEVLSSVIDSSRGFMCLSQFANDTLIFCKYDDGMLDVHIKAIELFEWCYSQNVNWEKSTLCGINVDEEKLISTSSRLQCKVELLPFLYHGLPLGGYPKKVSFWQPIIDKIQKKLDRWKQFNIYCRGRLTFCKAVLENLPIYYMSLYYACKSNFNH